VSQENRDKLKQTLKVLESFLEGKKFFAGEHPTIADISILSDIIQAKSAFRSIGNHPNIDSWFERCKNLPGFEENLNGAKGVAEFLKVKNIQLKSLD
jgi:glutathione S-transferase